MKIWDIVNDWLCCVKAVSGNYQDSTERHLEDIGESIEETFDWNLI